MKKKMLILLSLIGLFLVGGFIVLAATVKIEYKYNSSKAFCDKKFQDASFHYRHKLLEEIEQQYKVKPEDIEYEINVHNYSENKWVDEYERLWKGGEKI